MSLESHFFFDDRGDREDAPKASGLKNHAVKYSTIIWYNSTMSLNIKNEETHRLVQELAQLTGESMTTAVTEAVRDRLNRVKSKGMAERIRAISKQCAARLKGEPLPDHSELLYDENGLPK